MKIIGAVALVGAILGCVIWSFLPTGYQASTVLVLDSTSITYPGQTPFAGDPERYISGELEALRSYPVMARAAGLVAPSSSADQLRGSIDLTHVTGSDVVQVTARAGTSARASAMANAVAEAYVGRRHDLAQAALDGQRNALEQQAAQIGARLAKGGLVDAEAKALGATLAQINVSLAELAQPGVLHDSTRVVDTSRGAVSTRALSLPVAGVGGALLGALAALAVALVRALRFRRVTGGEEVEALSGRPLSAVFPHVRGLSTMTPEKLIDRLDAPAGRLATLAGPDGQQLGRPLVITCCGATALSGCSTVATALALRLAGDGLRVTVVTADSGRLPVPVHAPADAGSRRRGPDAPGAVPVDGGWQSIDGVLPRLTVTSRTDRRRLTSEDYAKALAEAAHVDVVVVDAASVLDSSFAAAAARESDRVVLVVPAMDQPESDLRLALEVLDATDVAVRVVLTHP